MTIEAGPKPNGVRTAAADSRNQKNKPGATDSQNGGFGAVLASVESSEKAEPPATETVDASAEAEVTTAPVVPSTLPDPTSNLPIQPVATDGRELGKDRDAKLLVETSVLGEFDEGKKFLPRDPVNAVAPAMLPVVDSAAMPNVAATDTAALLTQAAQGPAANVQNSQVDVQRSTERTGQSDVAGILARPSTPRPDAAPDRKNQDRAAALTRGSRGSFGRWRLPGLLQAEARWFDLSVDDARDGGRCAFLPSPASG
ncbi:MAG TPA: hypothetical protein PKH72_09045, partial [Rhodoferax sp.]|nr:hypothetical protein [Rhodoferax sp.]